MSRIRYNLIRRNKDEATKKLASNIVKETAMRFVKLDNWFLDKAIEFEGKSNCILEYLRI